MSTREQELREELAQLEAYAVSKHKAGDRHAVQDANSDLREIEARLDERQRTLAEVNGLAHANATPPADGLVADRQAARERLQNWRKMNETYMQFVNPAPGSLDSFEYCRS